MSNSTPKNAVVLLSGGLDSATVLAIAQSQGWSCHALTINYGQRHDYELKAAATLAARYKVASFREVKIDLRTIGGSALTADIAVPTHRSEENISQGIPITYVPARNTIMLSIALGLAETIPAFDIFVGVNAVDYSGYPDCRPEFITAFEQLANLATQAAVEGKGHFRIHAPLIRMTKTEIIETGLKLGMDYGLTSSCYQPTAEGVPCGGCDSCQIRQKAFGELGMKDPR